MYRRVEAGLGEYDFQYKFITSMIFQYYYCTHIGNLLAGTFLRVPNLSYFFVYGPFFSNRHPKYGDFPGLSETGLKTVRRLGVSKL